MRQKDYPRPTDNRQSEPEIDGVYIAHPHQPTTVEVPIKWLEKLIELSDDWKPIKIDNPSPETANQIAKLAHVRGYIESAKELFKIGGEDETP